MQGQFLQIIKSRTLWHLQELLFGHQWPFQFGQYLATLKYILFSLIWAKGIYMQHQANETRIGYMSAIVRLYRSVSSYTMTVSWTLLPDRWMDDGWMMNGWWMEGRSRWFLTSSYSYHFVLFNDDICGSEGSTCFRNPYHICCKKAIRKWVFYETKTLQIGYPEPNEYSLAQFCRLQSLSKCHIHRRGDHVVPQLSSSASPVPSLLPIICLTSEGQNQAKLKRFVLFTQIKRKPHNLFIVICFVFLWYINIIFIKRVTHLHI